MDMQNVRRSEFLINHLCTTTIGSSIRMDSETLDKAFVLRDLFYNMKKQIMIGESDLDLTDYHKSNANGVYSFLDETFAQKMEDE